MRQLSSILLLLSFYSCQVKSNKNDQASADSLNTIQEVVPENTSVSSNEEFNKYLSAFNEVSLPFSAINPDSLFRSSEPNDPSKFKAIRGERAFFNWWTYKRIPTNGKHIAVLTIELNQINNTVAVLETYTPDGKNIDTKVLDFGFEEYGNPSGSVEIKKDLSIYISAITTISQYDENGNEIPGPQKRKLFYIDGKILDDGKIQLSATSDKMLD